jgi:hypothetical protein
MENINTIEKVTLIVSTSIVFLANLFVLLEGVKQNRKIHVNMVFQKLFTIKHTFFAAVLIFLLSSCADSKFLSRRYTSGRFMHCAKTLKHNTIIIDTAKVYASVNANVELNATLSDKSIRSNNDMMQMSASSIVRKDSIFIVSRKGRNKKIVLKNDLPTVITYVSKNGNRVKTKQLSPIQAEKTKKNYQTKIKVCSIVALCFFWIPFLGLLLSCTAKKIIRKNQLTNPFKNILKYKVISNIALGLSILPTLCGVLILAFLIFALGMLLFGGGTMVVIM